jgi:hypothetical protein
MLSQLVYVSNRKANCSKEEIEKILRSCEVTNASLDITGVLLYSKTRFIQYLEGDARELLGLYDKIKGDKRHEKALIVSYGAIRSKEFPSWQMAAKEIAPTQVAFQTAISREDKQVFDRLLLGQEQSASSVLQLLKKFF